MDNISKVDETQWDIKAFDNGLNPIEYRKVMRAIINKKKNAKSN